MKKIYLALSLIGCVGILTSCQKYLNINENPNSATTSTPELMLPNALVATASVVNTYNTMGAQLGGGAANAGGYGGFGSAVTYSFSNSDYSGCWSGAYDNITDYQWIITNTEGDLNYSYYNGVAKIMKAYDFQLLVDTYNDVPYTEAFKEKANLAPAYDNAEAIYDSIYTLLDSGVASINAGTYDLDNNVNSNVVKFGDGDVVFAGNMDKWKQFANTVKLRIATRAHGILTFNNTYDAVGFLEQDAIVNPGYQKASGKQNPEYNSWAYAYNDTKNGRSWITSKWMASFYDGTKFTDYRGYSIYNNFATSSFASNQLGYESSSVTSAPTDGSWVSLYFDKANNFGILKGPAAGMPIFTAAESKFLQAEAILDGDLNVSGDLTTTFNAGILASYKYLYQKRDGTYDTPAWDPEADYEAYFENNPSSYIVNIDQATSTSQKLEAIITQKYIALNFINADQTWNDFRRTGYPTIVNGSTSATATFASTQSTSTRADKLPSRILYPTSELSYNSDHVPTGINQFTSLIFWDKN